MQKKITVFKDRISKDYQCHELHTFMKYHCWFWVIRMIASLAKEQWIIHRRLGEKMSFHLHITLLLTRKVIALSWKPPLHLEATPWLKDLWRCASVEGIRLCESITPDVRCTKFWFHGLMQTAQISLSTAFARKWQSGMDE